MVSKYKKTFSLIILLGFIVQSCYVTKEYQTPIVSNNQNLYRIEVLNNDSSNIAHLGWKSYFKDTMLIQHIEMALKNNKDLRIASQHILKAEARSSLKPKLD